MYDTDPKSTDDMVFADTTSETMIRNILSQKMPFPMAGKTGVLFYGTVGTGKTAYTQIFCDEFDRMVTGGSTAPIVEFIACDGTDRIDTIIRNCESIRSLVPLNRSPYHYFVFDEVDNLTLEGQRKLKSFLNHTNIVCVLTTNYIHKVDVGLRDRCHVVNFNAASTADCLQRTKVALRDNGLAVPSDAVLTTLIESADGSWRDIIPNAIAASVNIAPSHPPSNQPPKLKLVS